MNTLAKELMFKKETLSERKDHEDKTVYQQLVQTQSLIQLLRIENERIVDSFTWRLGSKLRSIIERYQIIYRLAHSVASRFAWRQTNSGNQKSQYQKWIEAHDCLSATDCEVIEDHIQSFAWKPLLSILFFVKQPEKNDLDRSLTSVFHQLYPHWELFILFDSSDTPKALKAIEEAMLFYKDSHPQSVRVVDTSCLNHNESVLDQVKGEYIVFLQSGDLLALHALYMLAFAVNWNDQADVLYSDEDFTDQNDERFAPYFKPDWNPDLFLSQNYIHNLCALKRTTIIPEKQYGDVLRKHTLYNLLLNVIGRTRDENIIHLPFVLYHNFTSSHVSEKAGIDQAGFQGDPTALSVYFLSNGIDARIEQHGKNAGYRIHYPVPEPSPLLSVIIPTAGNNMGILSKLVEDLILNTSYAPIEVLLVANNVHKTKKLSRIKAFEDYNQVRVMHYDGPFNHSAINNYAGQLVSGSLLCFLNDDIEIIHPEWLTEMAGHALRSEIGAVGAKLYYPNNLIQHAGLILGCGGAADHAFRWLPRGDGGYFGNADLVRNYSAVTAACMVMRKDVFDMVEWFDENLPTAFNDVDLCLKIRGKGYRILWTPYAELYHHESLSSRVMTPSFNSKVRQDMGKLQQKWASELIADPAFNPNLSLKSEFFAMADAPRIRKPWESDL
ncbi:MAG: glycosyltransferase [Proteobacteria bacterium]|nr:glycosyltransferase [Pseudomonadota bacterium]